MRYLILMITMAFSTHGHAEGFSKEECKEIFQAWVLNRMLEETCQFGGALSYRLGAMAKSACGDVLSEAEVQKFGAEVGRDLKDDYQRMGKKRLCEDTRPGYEAAVKTISR